MKTNRWAIAKESPKQAEDTHWFISISSGLGDALRNRLEDSLEPIRLNAAQESAARR